MELAELITPDRVWSPLKVGNKKQAIQELARRAATATGFPERQIADLLLERERLGTTGVGSGVAIPHAKLPALNRMLGFFARLDRPIDFDSVDGAPVDLICMLLAPENAGSDHLKALARVARLLRDRTHCAKLRGTENPEALYALLIEQPPTQT